MTADESFFDEVVEVEEDDSGSWLTTFADLSLLLMCFFVLLFSMSSLDVNRFTDSFLAVKQALSGKKVDIANSRIFNEEAGALVTQVQMQRQILESQRKVFSDMQFYQNTKGLEGVVGAHFDKGFITLRVPGDVMFAPGATTLSPKGKAVLDTLKDFFIKHADQRINIKGFTDNVQPSGGRFKDNWEISALRAVNVLRYLMGMGLKPNRLTATGLADLEPLMPNSSPQNRALNRRVEFVLEKRVGE